MIPGLTGATARQADTLASAVITSEAGMSDKKNHIDRYSGRRLKPKSFSNSCISEYSEAKTSSIS